MFEHVVLLTHPQFFPSKSMPRFAAMVEQLLKEQSVHYQCWTAPALFSRMGWSVASRKWLGYLDQYCVFPWIMRWRLCFQPQNTLFIFCDHALGPWVPLVSDKPHVIHCHDLMALKSSLGLIPENPVSFSGQLYQRYIRRGFEKGKHFIAISQQTQVDLHRYSQVQKDRSTVIYNGFNYPYKRRSRQEAFERLQRSEIVEKAGLTLSSGCLLHVGNAQWYKNTVGVIKLYQAYCETISDQYDNLNSTSMNTNPDSHLNNNKTVPLPLLLVSPQPSVQISAAIDQLPKQARVVFIQDISVQVLEALYSYATIFLFPSLAEGFGWPIIEALICGCPVITTDAAPMNEIGGPVARYLPKLDKDNESVWLAEGVTALRYFLGLSRENREILAEQAVAWASQFEQQTILDRYLAVYRMISMTGEAIGLPQVSLLQSTAPKAAVLEHDSV